MTSFVGIDLSWTGKYPSGLCVLVGDKKNVFCTKIIAQQFTALELVEQINTLGEKIIVSVDAPLVTTERRQAEKLLNHLFRKAKAPAYPATPKILEKFNFHEGPKIAELLKKHEFELDPQKILNGSKKKKIAFETYTHAAHIRLFDIAERIPYKRRKGRSIVFIKNELKKYQQHLLKILEQETPGILDNKTVLSHLKPTTIEKQKGKLLKKHEDTLDGLTCALVAYLFWRDGRSHWETIGSLPDGCVVIPRKAAYGRNRKIS